MPQKVGKNMRNKLILALSLAAAMVLGAVSSSSAHGWHHHHHWYHHHHHHWYHHHWASIVYLPYPSADTPYYLYSPRTIVLGVLTHHSTEIGPLIRIYHPN